MMKRMMSLLLCVMLLASSCLPAYAEIQTNTEQIHFAGETVQTAGIDGSALYAKFSKTLTEVEGKENEFNLTLTVETNQDVTKTQNMADAAVVLVFDLSGSMGYSKTPADTTNPSYDDTPDSSDRLDKAKHAALQFLDQFAESSNAANVQRQVAIVVFENDAKVVSVSTGEETGSYWMNVAESDNLTAVKDAVKGLKHAGATNTEGGLQIAYNLYKNTKLNGPVASIQNCNIILMTDGVPLEYIPNDVYGNVVGENGGPATVADQAAYFASLDLTGVNGTANQNTVGTKKNWTARADYVNVTQTPSNAAQNNSNCIEYQDSDRGDNYSEWGPGYTSSLQFGTTDEGAYYELTNVDTIKNFPVQGEAESKEAYDARVTTFINAIDVESDCTKYTDRLVRFPYLLSVVPYNSGTAVAEMGQHILANDISLYGVPIDMKNIYVQKNDGEYSEERSKLTTPAGTLKSSRIFKNSQDQRIGIPLLDEDDTTILPYTPTKQRETWIEPGYNKYESDEYGSAEWFKEWCTDAFRVGSDDMNSWMDTFNRIFNMIEASGSAWVVSDELSVDVVQTEGKSITFNPPVQNGKTAPELVDGKLTWDLKDMQGKAENGVYTYTCTIPVTLINTVKNIDTWSPPKNPGEADDANGEHVRTNALVDGQETAKLNCVFVKTATDGAPELVGQPQVLRAESPTVHAHYAESVEMTKKYVMIDKDGNAVTEPAELPGATFTLEAISLVDTTSSIGPFVMTSDENGKIDTKLLPAGDYKLSETEAPDGYTKSENVYYFTIKFGSVYHYYYVDSLTGFTSVEGKTDIYTDANGCEVEVIKEDGKFRVTNTMPYVFGDGSSTNNHPMEDWFVNKTEVGALNIVKDVESNFEVDKDREFEFVIRLTEDAEGTKPIGGVKQTNPETNEESVVSTFACDASYNGGQVTFVNGEAVAKVSASKPLEGLSLPHGVYYSVEEIDDPAFIMTAGTELTGQIEYDENGQTASVVSFTNTRRTGDLEITKIVTPYVDHPRDTEYEFQFTLTIDCDPSVSPPITGICGDLEFVDGVATFTLKHGETVKATGLPAGATYTLEEYGPGYNVVCDNMTGTIVGNNREEEDKNKIVKVLVENVEIYVDQPLTGDDSRLGLMLALLAISAAGLAVIAVRRRRSRSNG